jgi:thermitase
MKKTNLRAVTLASLLVVSLIAVTGLINTNQNTHAQKIKFTPDSAERFVPGRVLVKFREDIVPAHARNIIAALGARDAEEIPNIGVHILDLPYQANERAFLSAFKAQPEVEFAELDRIVEPADITPNDPWFANWEWHLKKIQAPTAWSTTTGSSAVVIAILDTGVDGTHEDLASQMVSGWNVYDNNSATQDIIGHGTHVAGTAAAASNNGIGVASVAWRCKIMPIRVSDLSGYATYSNIASGLNWATTHGARVANVSYAVTSSATVRTVAQAFQTNGGVVTVSSGNQGTFDSSPDNPYVLTIGATDQWDALYYYSNRGNNV